MNAYKKDMKITFMEKTSDSWFESDELSFTATNSAGANLFRISAKGSDAYLETYEGSDPVNCLLASFALVAEMKPKEFFKEADRAWYGAPLQLTYGISCARGQRHS